MDLHLFKLIVDIILIILTIASLVAAVVSGLFSVSSDTCDDEPKSLSPVIIIQVLFWVTLSIGFYSWRKVAEQELAEKVAFIEENQSVKFYIKGDNEILTVDSLSGDHMTVFANNRFFNTTEIVIMK